jgi:hypothetical protein
LQHFAPIAAVFRNQDRRRYSFRLGCSSTNWAVSRSEAVAFDLEHGGPFHITGEKEKAKGRKRCGPQNRNEANPKSPDYLGLAPLLPLLSGSIARIILVPSNLVCTSSNKKIDVTLF